STMHKDDFLFISEMNIQSDAIIINQTNRNSYEEFILKSKNKVKMYSFDEKGIGLSRNNALMRSTADICLMADDDMEYTDGYEEIVRNAFKKNPNADLIVFNVPILKKNGEIKQKVKKAQRIHLYN